MLYSKKIMLILFASLFAFSTLVFASAIVPQNSTLNGTVSAKNLVQKGAIVKEGDILVMIDCISGLAPATRANTNGTVTEVLVKPGDKVKSGQVLVQIKSSK